ncbi:MAG TPA: glucose-6-phosphate dehydrogenase assembly protein OpcA [Pyrinomonadaceae bacterium]|nr:glucose-6-phosphate dehydrogenase assembly protein OpcA [Pyrinomonadaceae bacterium]
MSTPPKQIQVPQTLDVDAVERALADLWQETAGGEQDQSEEAVMRARAANLMLVVTSDVVLAESQQTIRDLAAVHPCRALVMLADRQSADRDIEMFVSASCQNQQRSTKAELSCEEITLIARGQFASELPSAVIPLLVPDLPVFLWWHDLHRLDDDIFQPLSRAAERLVIDSVDLAAMDLQLHSIEQLFSRQRNEAIAVSDINWARLTSWRALLANFYDVQEYRAALADLERVRIDYGAPQGNANGIATQALLMAGWLASRLDWRIERQAKEAKKTLFFARRRDGGAITLELNRVERPEMRPGRLAKVELHSALSNASFVVQRAENGLHLETQATMEDRLCPGRTLPVRNRSTAELLAREMEILARDTTYEAAVIVAGSLGK